MTLWVNLQMTIFKAYFYFTHCGQFGWTLSGGQNQEKIKCVRFLTHFLCYVRTRFSYFFSAFTDERFFRGRRENQSSDWTDRFLHTQVNCNHKKYFWNQSNHRWQGSPTKTGPICFLVTPRMERGCIIK